MARIPRIGDFISRVERKIRGGLFLKVAERYLEEVQKTIISNAPTEDIKENVFIVMPRQENNKIVGGIRINIDDETGAPEAPAYEFGSGLYSSKGEKYPITPKNRKFLAFYWDKAHPSIPLLPDGRVILGKVMHPGVPPRPYIIPSFIEVKDRFLLNSISNVIRAEFSFSFER